MTAARLWYERALGAALVLLGVLFLLPLAYVWLWARHMYTLGLSVEWSHVAPVLIGMVFAFGVLALLGGIALMRRT